MLRVIDSHVHFWDPQHLRYAWLDDWPTLNHPCLTEHLPARGAEWQMEGLIFVQADCAAEQSLPEVEWVTSLAEAEGRIKGLVAFAPLELGEAARPTLEALKRVPLVKGIRRLIQAEPVGFSVQPGFVRGVQLLADFDFTFDLCPRHYHLRDVIELVRRCPQVRFVLDHCGKPDVKNRQLAPWQHNLTELARLPNVMCKLSGLVTEADWAGWRPADLRPFLDHVLEAFGVERVMFGSDWPVVTLAASHARWVEVALEATASFSVAELEKLFFQNSVKFYNLGLDTQ